MATKTKSTLTSSQQTAAKNVAESFGVSKISSSQQKAIEGVKSAFSTLPAVTSDSSTTRAANTATGNDISKYLKSFDDSGLRAASEAEARAIQAERDALNARRDAEVSLIEKSFDDTKEGTERAQEGEYAGRATNLITSGGGFLGATQSHQGVLQQLRETQRTELSALETKKQAAIRQAKNAYDDKDFALARDLVKSAREVEKEIYSRQQDYADRAIQTVKETGLSQDKATDNARQTLNTYFTNFGAFDPDSLNPVAKSDLISLIQTAKLDPNIVFAQAKTLGQQRIANAEENAKVTQALRLATLALARDKNNQTKRITAQDAKALQLPNSLVGTSEDEYYSSLKSSTPPQWFIEYKKDGAQDSLEKITKDWSKFKNSAVETGSGDFEWSNLSLPPVVK